MRSIALVGLLFLGGCLKESNLKSNDRITTPVQSSDGWQVSTPAAEGVDESDLQAAYNQFFSKNDLPHAGSLLIVRNGKLISEAYAQSNEDAETLHNTMSCTKSVVSMLFGIAKKKYALNNLNTTVSSFFPDLVPDDNQKRRISLRNCLTMQAGLEFNGGPDSRELAETNDNSISFIFNKKVIADTGAVFLYTDYCPQLINGVLSKVSGQKVEDFANASLFKPLGIDRFIWDASKDGLNYGAFSLFLRPRDLAKLGKLCLQEGNWNGTQLFDAAWMKEATTKQAKEENYGYYFWLDPGKKAYSMKGNGGQFVYVAPEKNLVIVYTAFPYSGPELWGDTGKLISSIYNACN